MQQQFKIAILNSEYILDTKTEYFTAAGKTGVAGSTPIPLDRFRSKDGSWYILWDKQQHSYYKPEAAPQPAAIPLSVEWVKVSIAEGKDTLKDRLDLLILLAYASTMVRTAAEEKLTRSDNNLKKALSLFLSQKP